MKSITLEEAEGLVVEKGDSPDFCVIDVRTPREMKNGVIGKPVNIDVYDPDFARKISGLDRKKTYLVYCRSGNRSKMAAGLMDQMGFENVFELKNGILDV